MSYSSWISNGTNVAYEPKEKNTGEVITPFSTTAPGGVPNSSYAPSTYVLAASGAWIAQTAASVASEVRRPSVYTELTGNPSPYFIATNTNLVYDADANHITTYGAFELAGLQVQNDASFTYTVFQTKAQTWTSCTLNISRNYASTQWTSGTEARFYLSTDSGVNWTLLLTDDYDSDPITVAIFSHTLATVNPSSLSAYQVKVEIDAYPSSAFNSVGVLYLQLYDIWIEGIYAVSGGSGTVTSITTTGANGVTISGGSTQTITTSGTFALALGAITPTSISTGTGYFSGDVEFASSIKSPNASNSPVTIAPDGTGDVHLNADSVRIGDNNSDATIATRGTGDLILTTHEGSAVEGIVRLYDGANGNITLTPNGTGQVQVGTDQVVTLTASQTLTNKTISGSTNTLSNIANASTTATSANTASAIVARDASGNFSAGTITANLTGNASGSSGSTTGNAATATALQTARAINGVNFDGTAAITVTAAAGTLTGATLASGVTASSLTSVGTLTGLTVSGTTSLATSSGFSQIGTASNYTSSKLQVYGNIDLVNTSTSQFIRFYDGTTFKGGLGTDDWVGGSSANLTLVSNGDSVFRTTGSATERMRIVGSTGNVGIGTASPSYRLHVSASDTSNVVGGSAAAINISNSNAAAFGRTVDLDFSVGGGASAERIAGLSAVYTSYGTSVGGALAFCTNNGSASFAERMRITSGGDVGIGTASPGYKLTVAGTSGTAVVSLLETGVRSWGIRAGGVATNIFDIADFTAGASRLSIDSSGNVGIGTASPSQKITLGGQTGASATPLALQFSADWSDGYVAAKSKIFLFNNGGSGMWGFAVGPDNDIQYHSGGATNTNGQHKWYSGNVEFMRLNASGNLGIGTASPSTKLHVSNAGVSAQATFVGTTGSPYITVVGNSGTTILGNESNGGWVGTTGSQSFVFKTTDIERVRIDSSGNVGIGTSSTTFKLDVQGSSAGYLEAVRFKNTNAAGYLTTSWTVGSAEATIRYFPGTFFKIGPDSGDTTTPILFATNNGTERMRIDSTQVKATVPFIGNSGTKGFGGITTTTSTSTPTGGSSGDHYYIY